MVKLKSLRLNSAAIAEGEWRSTAFDGFSVLVRGYRNSAYQQAYSAALRRARQALPPEGVLAVEDIEAIRWRLTAEHLVLGWKGLADDDDAPIEWSPETAAQLFADPDLILLRDAVEMAISNVGTTLAATTEEAKGKLIAALRYALATEGGEQVEWLRLAAEEARQEGDIARADELVASAAQYEPVDLLPWLHTTWAAFWRLNRGRSYATTGAAGAGGVMLRATPRPLAFEVIDRYAVRYGIEGEEFDLMYELLVCLDDAWLEIARG